jgi:hypothetical protein
LLPETARSGLIIRFQCLACQFEEESMQGYGDNFIPVIPVSGDLEHTGEKPFCWNVVCGCHEDRELISEVAQHVEQGLMTSDEATDFVAGKGI